MKSAAPMEAVTASSSRTSPVASGRLEDAVTASIGAADFILQPDQYVVFIDGHGIVADQLAILVEVAVAADLLDALGIARKSKQGFDGLVPGAAAVGRLARLGRATGFAAVAAVQNLHVDTIALRQHVQQQERFSNAAFVEHAGQDQSLRQRVVGQSLTDRSRQLGLTV